MPRTHKDLKVWEKSIDFVTTIYKITKNFPKDEIYGLVSQLRRASVSISSNIAEGAVRNGKKEFVQFLYIALSSASEVETQLIISYKLNYIPKDEYEMMINEVHSISKMIQGLIKSVIS